MHPAPTLATLVRELSQVDYGDWSRAHLETTLAGVAELTDNEGFVARSVAEEREYRDFTWGVIDSVPYLWRADVGPALPPGTNVPGGYVVESIDDFATQLTAIAESLAEGVAVFPDLGTGVNITVWGPGERCVQWWADAGTSSALADGSWTHFPLNGPQDAVSAVLASVRAWGVEDAEELDYACYAMEGRRSLTMPGLGLTARAG